MRPRPQGRTLVALLRKGLRGGQLAFPPVNGPVEWPEFRLAKKVALAADAKADGDTPSPIYHNFVIILNRHGSQGPHGSCRVYAGKEKSRVESAASGEGTRSIAELSFHAGKRPEDTDSGVGEKDGESVQALSVLLAAVPIIHAKQES